MNEVPLKGGGERGGEGLRSRSIPVGLRNVPVGPRRTPAQSGEQCHGVVGGAAGQPQGGRRLTWGKMMGRLWRKRPKGVLQLIGDVSELFRPGGGLEESQADETAIPQTVEGRFRIAPGLLAVPSARAPRPGRAAGEGQGARPP